MRGSRILERPLLCTLRERDHFFAVLPILCGKRSIAPALWSEFGGALHAVARADKIGVGRSLFFSIGVSLSKRELVFTLLFFFNFRDPQDALLPGTTHRRIRFPVRCSFHSKRQDDDYRN